MELFNTNKNMSIEIIHQPTTKVWLNLEDIERKTSNINEININKNLKESNKMTYSTFPPLHDAIQLLNNHSCMITEDFLESFHKFYESEFHTFTEPFNITIGKYSFTIY